MIIMNYELIALDLDDTLLNKDNKITQRTIAMVHELIDRGVVVTIATGRMLSSSLPYIEKLDITTPVITYNGAYVRDIENEQTIYHQSIQPDIAKNIIEDAENEGLHINYYENDSLYVAEYNYLVELYEEIAGIKAEVIGSLVNNTSKKPTKLLIIEDDPEKKEFYYNLFSKKYDTQAEIKESKQSFIEFTDKGVSKGRSLARLAARYNIPQEKVVAIGDGWNDADMLEWAGLGIAMGNSNPRVKERADLIAPPHDKDGAASILADVFEI
jgi:hypothetical protein